MLLVALGCICLWMAHFCENDMYDPLFYIVHIVDTYTIDQCILLLFLLYVNEVIENNFL